MTIECIEGYIFVTRVDYWRIDIEMRAKKCLKRLCFNIFEKILTGFKKFKILLIKNDFN